MQGTSVGARRSKISKVLSQVNDATSTSGLGGCTRETSINSKLSIEKIVTSGPSYDVPHDTGSFEIPTNNTDHPYNEEPLLQAVIQGKDNEELFTEDHISAITHDDGMAILDEYFLKSPVGQSRTSHALVLDTLRGSEDEIAHRNDHEATARELLSRPQPSHVALNTTSLTEKTTPVLETYQTEPLRVDNNLLAAATHARLVKRTTLDESGSKLDDVMKALAKTTDTARIPDFIVPGVSEYLAKDEYMDYSKIATSIATNCVNSSRNLSKSALFAEKERLQDYERDMLERIAEDRQQMNMTLPARLASELNHQQYADRLKKATQRAIVRLDLKELAEKELQDTLTEPSELTGEFRDENDFEKIIKQFEKDRANSTKTQQRSLWKETFYWPIIQQRAKMVGQLPNHSGPKTDITSQEKTAAKRLILALGYGISRDNIFKWTSYWKLLSDLRSHGLTTLLLYRTSEFKTYFFRNKKN